MQNMDIILYRGTRSCAVPLHRARRRSVLVALLTLSTILMAACGDDDGSSGDGGTVLADADGSTGSEAGAEAGLSPDGAIPGTPLERYCSGAAEFLERCGDTLGLDACDTETLSQCVGANQVEREEFLVARAECGFPDGCPSYPDFAQRLCVFEATRDLTPTAAQTELSEALCEACPLSDDTECPDTFFFRPAPRDDGTTVVGGAGSSYFHLNDTLVGQIRAECVPAPGTDRCWLGIYNCIEEQVEAAQPPSLIAACRSPGPGPVGI
jgi:hypothetical protein